MGAEALERDQGPRIVEPEMAAAIGTTAFDTLAQTPERPLGQPSGEGSFDFSSSVTRHPDGQTVPDE